VADATGTTVWRWDQQEPFGANPAHEDPDGNSVAFDLPLRLPGQRYDAETGLHYNYFRDYDPSLGIYKQSDLIGLRGGLNTYAYGAGNPILYVDPTGEGPAFFCGAALLAATAYGLYSLAEYSKKQAEDARQYADQSVKCAVTSDEKDCGRALADQATVYGSAARTGAAGAGMGRGFPSSRPTSPTSVAPYGNQPRLPNIPPGTGRTRSTN
jgi:RHS repeat-associated protein